ncbi:MAG: hypothetical protein CLLPBCKN_007086 [Chroococcidiopsis cubana SAG 39.79]|uniref:hypothetical protein n=1 Tax=Chroococcidiopsis cubana TaxID=171392 RepID=UPI000D078565|nr:hypothetical protein [Chroococcidiopsis cubana]MDZ4877651.1 hypothetical protein [Chroococcidiopsis cubana SAG 39.79]
MLKIILPFLLVFICSPPLAIAAFALTVYILCHNQNHPEERQVQLVFFTSCLLALAALGAVF